MTARAKVADPYLLRGLVTCTRCRRVMVAALVDGRRAYHCGPGCEQVAVDAAAAEADLLLSALIRCAVMLHADLRSPEGPAVTAEELARWQRCDVADRRDVLVSAYNQVLVNAEGRLRPVWRHRRDQRARIGNHSGYGGVDST